MTPLLALEELATVPERRFTYLGMLESHHPPKTSLLEKPESLRDNPSFIKPNKATEALP